MGPRASPRAFRAAIRPASRRDPRPFAGLNLKNEGKRTRPVPPLWFRFKRAARRAFARGGGRAAPRSAREKKRTIAAIAGRARAGRAATYLLLLLLHVLLRAELVRLRGMGGRRAQRDGHGDKKTGRAGADAGAARVLTRGRCAIVAVESRIATARSSRARGDENRAARGPRTPDSLRRRTGRMGKPRVRRTGRRRGVSSARVPLGGSS